MNIYTYMPRSAASSSAAAARRAVREAPATFRLPVALWQK